MRSTANMGDRRTHFEGITGVEGGYIISSTTTVDGATFGLRPA